MTIKVLDKITKEEFQAYESVRSSGVLNMWDSRVCQLAGIDKATHCGIIEHYYELMQKWPDVRKEEDDGG